MTHQPKQDLWQRLLIPFTRKRLPPAFLLSGKVDLDVIQKWEQLILCQQPLPDKACGSCRSCILYLQGNHPDQRRLGNDEKISIDEIREITHFLSQSNHQKSNRIVTLLNVDTLSPAAANALLKTLEEPPVDTYFLLVAQHLSLVLPTIRSRCVVIPIPVYERKLLDKPQASLFKALFLGEGNALFREDVQRFITTGSQEALYFFYYWVTDAIRYALACPTALTYTQEELTILNTLSTQSVPSALKFLDKVNEALHTVTLPGVNKTLLLESLFDGWHQTVRQANEYTF